MALHLSAPTPLALRNRMKTYLSAPPSRPTRVRYGVLAFACALSMITYLDRVCFGTVAPFIQEEFHLSDWQLGWLFTAFALAYAIFEVPTGWLGDVFGPRATLIRIVLWWSVFTAATGWAWSFASMVVITEAPRFGRPRTSSTRFCGRSWEARPDRKSLYFCSSPLRP